MNRAAKSSNVVTLLSQLILNFIWAMVDSTESPACDINAKFVYSWHQTCQHSQVFSQAIQDYRLYLTNGVYLHRSQAAWTLDEEISSRFLETFSNLSYALIGGLAQLMVAPAIQTPCSVSGMLTSAPIAVSRLTHATQYTSLPKCLLCYCLIYINKLDCALSNTRHDSLGPHLL